MLTLGVVLGLFWILMAIGATVADRRHNADRRVIAFERRQAWEEAHGAQA